MFLVIEKTPLFFKWRITGCSPPLICFQEGCWYGPFLWWSRGLSASAAPTPLKKEVPSEDVTTSPPSPPEKSSALTSQMLSQLDFCISVFPSTPGIACFITTTPVVLLKVQTPNERLKGNKSPKFSIASAREEPALNSRLAATAESSFFIVIVLVAPLISVIVIEALLCSSKLSSWSVNVIVAVAVPSTQVPSTVWPPTVYEPIFSWYPHALPVLALITLIFGNSVNGVCAGYPRVLSEDVIGSYIVVFKPTKSVWIQLSSVLNLSAL